MKEATVKLTVQESSGEVDAITASNTAKPISSNSKPKAAEGNI